MAFSFLFVTLFISKTCLYNVYPLKPHFYIVKLGFTRVYIIFLISAQKHRLWYSLEPPRWGGSNEYPQSMFWAEEWKISEFLIWKFSFFGGKKFSVYLNRRVFVMFVWLMYMYHNKKGIQARACVRVCVCMCMSVVSVCDSNNPYSACLEESGIEFFTRFVQSIFWRKWSYRT